MGSHHIILKLLLICSSNAAIAAPLPQDGNLREACRKVVAGKYLSLYDKEQEYLAYKKILMAKELELKSSLKIAKKNLSVSQSKLEKAGFDLDLTFQRDSLKSRVDIISHTIAAHHDLFLKTEKKHIITRDLRLKFQEKMRQVFDTKKKINGKSGYGWEISYKSSCPPYRYSCRLPKKFAQALKKIFGEETPVVCQRYADFLHW